MSKIDFRKIVENLSEEKIIQLVSELGCDDYINKTDCIIFKTICHNEDVTDANMKLYYYKKDHRFMCYTDCGCSFDIFTLFEKRYELLNIEYNFYQDILLKIVDKKNDNFFLKENNDFFNRYETIYDKYKSNKPKVHIDSINKTVLKIFNFYPTPEWLEEGITEKVMKYYNILYSIPQNRIIIPHYDCQGRLIGIRGRALNQEDIEIGKYMPVQIENKIYSHPLMYNLYGLNLVKNNIKKYKMAIVAEGEKSPMLGAAMFGIDKNICVACCGSNFSRYQLQLLLSVGAEKILIAFDKEGKTQKEKEKYFLKLYKICKKYKNLCKMGFIYDNYNLLELKDSPFDKGLETTKKLIRTGVWL